MKHRLRVDMTRCRADGYCAELLPERVTLDDWGYPIVDGAPIDGALYQHAREAAKSCRRMAVILEPLPRP